MKRPRGWRLRVVTVAAVTLIILFSYYYLNYIRPSEASLVIYTYNSLLKYGLDPADTYDKVFSAFGRKYNIQIIVKNFSDTGALLPALLGEKNDPKADVVIGLTPVMIQQAKQNELLEQYTPNGIDSIPTYLVQDMDPEHYATPYEYSMISLDYDNFVNQSAYPRIANLTYTDFYDGAYSDALLLENPTLSAPGLDFLLGQIAFYNDVLHEDWHVWWNEVKGHAKVTSSWDEAFGLFSSGTSGYHIVVSYAADPAYNAYFNYTIGNTTVMHYGSKAYGWLEILGIGIVRNAKHIDMARNFVDWFIGETVQEQIPLNEWVYPARSDVPLPEVYKYALNASDVIVLNNFITPEAISENLTRWLQEWQSITQS